MESTPSERRDTRRVALEPGFTVHFHAKGQAYSAVNLANLSRGGCFATLPAEEGRRLERGDALEFFLFDDACLPGLPLTARVAYALHGEEGEGPEALAFTGLGVAFVAVPPEVQAALERFVALNLGEEALPRG